MSFKTFLVVLLFVVLLAGATGGSDSARNVGEALNQAVHWMYPEKKVAPGHSSNMAVFGQKDD